MTSDLIREVTATIRKFIFFKNERVPLLIATWVLATYIYDRFQCFPILWINSPVMRCGKSRLVDIIDKIAWRSSGSTVNASPAALFRMTADGCTFLADEVENLRNADKEQYGAVISIFNSGFAARATVPRVERTNDGWRVKKFSVYGPKVLAGIANVSDTIRDRSLCVKMSRKSKKERTARLSMRKQGRAFDSLRDQIALWAEQNNLAIQDIYENLSDDPSLEGCDDRFLDIVEPLLSIVRFADAEAANGAERITDEIMPLLKELGGQRAEAQADEAIAALCVLFESLLDGEEEIFIPSAELLEKMRQTPGLHWIGSTKALGTFMSKLDLVSKPEWVVDDDEKRKQVRGYCIKIETLNDIKSRYASPSPGFEASQASQPASDGLENDFSQTSQVGGGDT